MNFDTTSRCDSASIRASSSRSSRPCADSAHATVTFVQLWRAPTDADRGTKELALTLQGGAWRAAREETRTAERWDGRIRRGE